MGKISIVAIVGACCMASSALATAGGGAVSYDGPVVPVSRIRVAQQFKPKPPILSFPQPLNKNEDAEFKARKEQEELRWKAREEQIRKEERERIRQEQQHPTIHVIKRPPSEPKDKDKDQHPTIKVIKKPPSDDKDKPNSKPKK